MPADDNKRNDHADRLGKSGSKSGAGGSQMQGAHKEIIQRDIGGTCHGDKVHGAFAVAQPAENGADDIICRDKRNADKTDGQIFYGSRHRGLRRGHYIYNRPDKNKKYHSKHHRQAHKQRDRIADTGSGFFPVAGAHSLTDGNRGTHGEPYDHDREHMHYLGADGHSRCTGDAFKLADDKQIGHSVKSLQKIRKKIGQGKKQDVSEYAARG